MNATEMNEDRAPEAIHSSAGLDTPEQRMEAVLAEAYHGIHHVGNIKKTERYWQVTVPAGIATFDFDTLTLLVLAAHEHCVRVEISNGGPNMLLIRLHPRKREGRMFERHPTIEDAIARYNAPSCV